MLKLISDPAHIWIAVSVGSAVVLLSTLLFVLVIRRMLRTFLDAVESMVKGAEAAAEKRMKEAAEAASRNLALVQSENRETLRDMRKVYTDMLAEALRDYLRTMDIFAAEARAKIERAMEHAKSFDGAVVAIRETLGLHAQRLEVQAARLDVVQHPSDEEAAARLARLERDGPQ